MKTTKILYYISTVIISLMFLVSAAMSLTQNPEMIANMAKLGFPIYFAMILGTAKLLGVIALWNPWFPKLREWAYAGFTFVLIGAAWTHMATSTPFAMVIVIAAILGVSYYSRSKIQTLKIKA